MAVTGIDSSTKPAELRLLGALELRDGNGRAVADILVRPRLFGILAYLATAGESFVRREKLLGMFWPEHDDEHSRGALRTSLYRIRNAFPDELIETRGADDVRLFPQMLSCDANEFARAASHREWESALVLYTGDFLDGFHIDDAPSFERWLDEKQSHYRALAVRCARELVRQSRSRHDLQTAVAWASRWVELAPAEEMAARELMSIYLETGEKGSALNVFEAFSERLRATYQTEPSPETQRIADDLRSSGTGRSTPTRPIGVIGDLETAGKPAPVAVHSLGEKPSLEFDTFSRKRTVRYGIAAAIAAGLLAAIGGLASIARSPVAAADQRVAAASWRTIPIASKPIPRSHPSFVYDPRVHEAALFGGRQNESALADLWRLHRADGIGQPVWERIATTLPGPGARWIHEAHYDPATDRMIVFGGARGYTSPCSNDVWVLHGAMNGSAPLDWQKINVGGGPAPRAELGSIYDPVSNRLLVFGGHDCIAPIFDDMWILTNANGVGKSEWTRIRPRTPAGSPGPRRSQSMAYDPATNRAILFGGSSDYGAHHFQNDVWILTHANGIGGIPEWRPLATLGEKPEPRAQHRAIFDAETNRLVVIGGEKRSGVGGAATLDLWVLTGANGTTPSSTWSKLSSSSTDMLLAFGAAFDPASQRIMIYGGARLTGGTLTETSELRVFSRPYWK